MNLVCHRGALAGACFGLLMMCHAATAEEVLPDCDAELVGVRCVEARSQVDTWSIEEVVPPVGSQNALIMTTPSFQTIPGIFGRGEPAALRLLCIENTTQFEIRFGENFMSDVGDFGLLVYKIDDSAPVQLAAAASPDNFALGLYNGAEAIPLIRSLFGGERLLVSATSFTGRTITASFSIGEIEAAADSLRALCNW